MGRKLIIDGNAVYEIDEECMLKRRVDQKRDCEDKRENIPGAKTDIRKITAEYRKTNKRNGVCSKMHTRFVITGCQISIHIRIRCRRIRRSRRAGE